MEDEEDNDEEEDDHLPAYLYQFSMNLSLTASTIADLLFSMMKDELKMRRGEEISPIPATHLLICVENLESIVLYIIEEENDLATTLSSACTIPTLSFDTLFHPSLLDKSFKTSPYDNTSESYQSHDSSYKTKTRYNNNFKIQPPSEFIRI